MKKTFQNFVYAMATRAMAFAGLSPSSPELARWFGGGGFDNLSGIVVDANGALMAPAVYAAVSRIANQVATLPIKTYRKIQDDQREPDTVSRLSRVLKLEPNDWQTPFEFKRLMTTWLLLASNAYAEIVVTRKGLSLKPLNPVQVAPKLTPDGQIFYEVWEPKGTRRIARTGMMHLRGLSLDGLVGLPVFTMHQQSLGLSILLEQFTATHFSNGCNPSVVVEMMGTAQAQWDAYKKWFEENFAGVRNNRRALFVPGGGQVKPVGFSNTDSGLIELRQFQLSETARLFGIQPHLIGDLSRSTNNNIEQQFREFLTLTLDPILVQWEQAITRDLIPAEDRGNHYAEFDRSALLQADMLAKFDSYSKGIMAGWMAVNEARRRENMAPVEGGDQHFVPSNLRPLRADMADPIQNKLSPDKTPPTVKETLPNAA